MPAMDCIGRGGRGSEMERMTEGFFAMSGSCVSIRWEGVPLTSRKRRCKAGKSRQASARGRRHVKNRRGVKLAQIGTGRGALLILNFSSLVSKGEVEENTWRKVMTSEILYHQALREVESQSIGERGFIFVGERGRNPPSERIGETKYSTALGETT